jgi:hypothetical protein
VTPCTFYLGTHKPGWLSWLSVALMVSLNAFAGRSRFPHARAPWFLDSGGFTMLAKYGLWPFGPQEFIRRVSKVSAQVGKVRWIAPQDWMCEPDMVAKTGLSVVEHQRRTVANFVQLRELAPSLPIIPVLQGWEIGDYYDCRRMYEAAGVDLTREPLVGVGSVCRRQHVREVAVMIEDLAGDGLRLHGFGFKKEGLRLAGHALASADSLAWSKVARLEEIRLPGCPHATCANCQRFAMQWRAEVVGILEARAAA